MARTVIPVSAGASSYNVILAGGLLDQVAGLLEDHCPASRYALITDSSVGRLYGQRITAALGGACSQHTFPAGEWNKTRDTWSSLTDELLAAGFDRDAAIIALGGGVVGDLAGFTAATYLRGIRYVQVPTSLLAMIDSSIGGKTGLDTPFGKNLVGAFHQPELVLSDTDTLGTLPKAQLAAGMAEAIKHGAICDAAYYAQLRGDAPQILERDTVALHRTVVRSVEIKATVVAEDVHDRGRRSVLNFGHTVAHAIEAATGYEHLHGEAVAIGMLAEAELGVRLGITDPAVSASLRSTLELLGLPTEPITEIDASALIEAMKLDKKNRAGSVMFALLERIGQAARTERGSWTVEAPENVVREVLNCIA